MPLPNLSNRASNSRATTSLNGQDISASTYREQVREKILNSPRRNMDKSMSNGDFRRSIDLNFTSENILFNNDQQNRNSLNDFRPKTPRRQDSAFRGNRQVIVYNKTYVPSATDGFINNDDNQNEETFSQESSNLKTNTPVNFKSSQTNSLSNRHRKKSLGNQNENANLSNSMMNTFSRNDSINNEESRPNSIETNPDLIDNEVNLRRCKSSYSSRSRQSFYPTKSNNDEFDLIESSNEYSNSNFRNNSKNGDKSNANQKENNNNSTNYFMNNNRRSRHSNLIDNGNNLSNNVNTRRSLNIEKNTSDLLFKNDYIDDGTTNHSTKSSHDFRSTSRASFRDDSNSSSNTSNSYYPVPTPRKTTGQTSNNNQSNTSKTNLFSNNSNIYQDSNNMTDFRIKRNSHASLNKILTPKVPYTPTPRKSLSNKQHNQLDNENSHLFNQASNEESFISGSSNRKMPARANRSSSRDSNNFNTSYSNSNINFNSFHNHSDDNDDANDDADDYFSYSSGNNASKSFNENQRHNKANNNNFNYSHNKQNYKNFN